MSLRLGLPCLTILVLLSLSFSSVSSSAIAGFQEVLEVEATTAAAAAMKSTQYSLEFLEVESRLSSPTITTSTDPGSSCAATPYSNAAAALLENGFASLSEYLMAPLGQVVGESASSAVIAEYVNEYLPTILARSFTGVVEVNGFEGGLGAGFGYELYCNGQLLVTLGGGGGGGVTSSGGRVTGGLGGGGGAQTNGNTVSAGGGTGCAFTNGAPSGCTPTPDAGGQSFAVIREHIQASLDICRSGMVVCGGGGGGGGFSYSYGASSCHYGGGFGFSFTGIAVFAASANGNATEVEERRQQLLKEAAVTCPSDSYDQITSSAANDCNAECAGKPGYYNSCYCPCFKSRIESAGLSWGYTMACTV